MTTMWTGVPYRETPSVRFGRSLPTLDDMSSTMLTKRRAVDHCRTRSSLCRMH
jgi:hypothetical protein